MERAAGSERTPLLAGQNSSDALGLDHHLDMDCSSRRRTLAHQQGGEVPDESLLSGSPLHSYSPLSVFFVFFFPALGGLLFGLVLPCTTHQQPYHPRSDHHSLLGMILEELLRLWSSWSRLHHRVCPGMQQAPFFRDLSRAQEWRAPLLAA